MGRTPLQPEARARKGSTSAGKGRTTPSGPPRAWLNTGRRRTDVQNYIHLTKSSRVLGRAVRKKSLARQGDLNACAQIGYEENGYGTKKRENFPIFFHCVFAVESWIV